MTEFDLAPLRAAVPRRGADSACGLPLPGKENFHITGIPMSTEPCFVKAFGYVKKAAALANRDLGVLDAKIANAERTRDMVLNSLGIVTLLKPSLGYKQCAEIAREGYETGKSLHDIVVKERKLLTQEKWDEVFSFENLVSPKFEQ